MANTPKLLRLTRNERRELLGLLSDTDTSARAAVRIRIVLLAAEGMTGRQIATLLGCSEPTVVCWRRRFVEGGGHALLETGRAPSNRGSLSGARDLVLATTLLDGEKQDGSEWSTRSLAASIRDVHGVAISHDSIARLWRTYGLRRVASGSLVFDVAPALAAHIYDSIGLHVSATIKILATLPAHVSDPGCGMRRSGLACLSGAMQADQTRDPRRSGSHSANEACGAFLSRLAKSYPTERIHLVVFSASGQEASALQANLEDRYPRMLMHQAADLQAWLLTVHACVIAADASRAQFANAVIPAEVSDRIADNVARSEHSSASFSWVKTPALALRQAAQGCAATKTKEAI